MKALQKKYGKEEGESIYNKMESEGKNVRKNPKRKVRFK